MNSRQRLVLAIGALLVAVQLVCPPWIEDYLTSETILRRDLGRRWIWDKPASTERSSTIRIHSSKVSPGIALVIIAGFVAFHAVRTRPQDTGTNAPV